MRLARPLLPLLLTCAALLAACGEGDAPAKPEPPDFYSPGDHPTRTLDLGKGLDGAPLDLLVVSPVDASAAPVVVFVHGFVLQNDFYTNIFEHLASHGFVVVAPQFENSLQDTAPAAEDADRIAQTIAWIKANLASKLGAPPNTDTLGLAGHSRGAKVSWSLLQDRPDLARALAGLDPVDGTGGPDGDEPRVVDQPVSFNTPTFILGAGLGPDDSLGQACAPAGDNHVKFWDASQSPAWHVVAPDYGHMDMIGADTGCTLFCDICPGNDDKQPMRDLTQGMLAAFFHATLRDDPGAFAVLSNTEIAPASILVDRK